MIPNRISQTQRRVIQFVIYVFVPLLLCYCIFQVRYWQPLNVSIGKGHSYIIGFSPDEDTVVSGGGDKLIRFWSYKTKRLLFTLSGHKREVSCLAFSHNGQKLVSSDGKEVILWNTKRRVRINSFESSIEVWSAAISPDDSQIAVTGVNEKKRVVEIWGASSQKMLNRFFFDGTSSYSIDFSPSGELLATGGTRNHAEVWSVFPSSKGHDLEQAPLKEGDFAVTFSPNGQLIAAGGRYVKLWDVQTGKLLHTFQHRWASRAIAFSSDSKTLAVSSGDQDNSIWIWNVKTGALKRTIQWRGHTATPLTFWNSDKTLIAGSDIGAVQSWRLRN